MKRLETTLIKEQSYFSRALRAITTSVSSLLIWIKVLINVGFAIIAVVILGALFDVMVRMYNYRNGTKLRTGQIFKDFLTSLWKISVLRGVKKYNYQTNSQASAQRTYQQQQRTPSNTYKKEE